MGERFGFRFEREPHLLIAKPVGVPAWMDQVKFWPIFKPVDRTRPAVDETWMLTRHGLTRSQNGTGYGTP